MTVQYVSVEDAIKRGGLRMVVVGNVPSPWGEAAKGILHIKGIDWVAVRLAYDSEPLKDWAGQRTGPVAVYEDERPRAGWAEILLLAERLAPTPSLLPADAAERALVFGLAHEICGEDGLGWARRLQLVHAGLQNTGGFPAHTSQYLAKKYGYHGPATDAAAGVRVVELLGMLAARLRTQHQAGRCLQCDLHGAVRPAAARALCDGLRHAGSVRNAGCADRRGARSDPAGASRQDVRDAPGAAALALIRRLVLLHERDDLGDRQHVGVFQGHVVKVGVMRALVLVGDAFLRDDGAEASGQAVDDGGAHAA